MSSHEMFPFQGHRELFSEDVLNPYLDGLAVKSDKERIQEVMISMFHLLNKKQIRPKY